MTIIDILSTKDISKLFYSDKITLKNINYFYK